MKLRLALGMGGLLAAHCTLAAELFHHDFDRVDTLSNAAGGCNALGWEVMDRGITETQSVSGRKSVFVVVDFSQSEWGAILLCKAGEALDLTTADLTVQLQASKDISRSEGCIGFQLIDQDGTTARTHDAVLFQPTDRFAAFTQKAKEVTLITEPGDDLGLDYSRIVQYGILFLDRGDIEDTITFHIDDFTGRFRD